MKAIKKKITSSPETPRDETHEEADVVTHIENPKGREVMSKLGQERVYMNIPEDLEKYKGKKPRIVVYFHGDHGSIDSNLPLLKSEITKMREDGDPVILVIPENRIGGWQDFTDPEAFNKLISMTDEASGIQNAEITITSHSGGYLAVQNILKSGDQYDRIKSLGLLDSAYHNSNKEFIKFASDPTKKMHSVFTKYLTGKNEEMIAALIPGVNPQQEGNDTVWKDDSGRIEIRSTKTGHTVVPKVYFRDFAS